MNCEIRRIRQLFSLGADDLLWLICTVGVGTWVHHMTPPIHELYRRHVRRRRNKDAESRLAALKRRIARGACTSGQEAPRVALATLSPELDEICRPLRDSHQEIALADIDQDGALAPRYSSLWAGAVIAAQPFLQRRRFAIAVVDWNGWVGVRKNFRGDTTAFVNELEAVLDLRARGCAVPEVFAVDFDLPSITFSYIVGTVVREELAQAGAQLRDRDLRPIRNEALHRIRQYWLDRRRTASGRRLIGRVLDKDSISRIEAGLLAIHRSGYCLGDIKYGNIIIQADTKTPYFIDFEYALPLNRFNQTTATYLRDCDSHKLNGLFGTNLPTAKGLRRLLAANDKDVYSPFYVGSGVYWGAFWNPDVGIQRWRHILAEHVPVPPGGRVLDLGANNGFNAIQILRAGAAEVVAVEINPNAIEQGRLVKRVFEWADNREYRLNYICGSHGDLASMDLGQFDLVTAFCTLYYLSQGAMAKTVADLASLTDTLVLQCNDENSIHRDDAATFEKASLQFNTALVRSNGFPHVSIVEASGSQRPLVIGRTQAKAPAHHHCNA
jgi:hypothetical protein